VEPVHRHKLPSQTQGLSYYEASCGLRNLNLALLHHICHASPDESAKDHVLENRSVLSHNWQPFLLSYRVFLLVQGIQKAGEATAFAKIKQHFSKTTGAKRN